MIALRLIFKKPSEEEWISIEKLKRADVFLKDYSLVIMLKFLNTSTVRIAGENVNSGVDSQRLKGKNSSTPMIPLGESVHYMPSVQHKLEAKDKA